MPFITAKEFRLVFMGRKLNAFERYEKKMQIAVGKISIGYHDMDGKFFKKK